MGESWTLSVDFGTSYTTAAMSNGSGPEVVEIDGLPRMLSSVFWRDGDDGGHLVLGEEAENSAATEPDCFERCPKRRINDDFLLLGTRQVRVVEAVADIIDHAAAEAIWRQGGRPGRVRLTHPARWQGSRLGKLSEAASIAGFGEVSFVSEPVAAAVHFASAKLSAGDRVAVYDLGGGTFDTAVLERTADGFMVIANGGKEDLGGEDFDYRLYQYLGEQLAGDDWAMLTADDVPRPWKRANADFRRAVRDAKEKLSKSPDTSLYIALPVDASVSVTRSELESLIRDDIETTVTELEATIGKAKMAPGDLRAVYLAGGSSRMPIVTETITERLGREPSTFGDPKAVTALGAVKTVAPAPAKPAPPDQPPEPEGQTPPEPEGQAPPEPEPQTPPGAGTPPELDAGAAAKAPRHAATDAWLITVVALALASIGSLFIHQTTLTTGWNWFGSHTRGIEFIVGWLAVVVLAVARRMSPRARLTLAAAAIATALAGGATVVPLPGGYHYLRPGFWAGAVLSVILALVLGVRVWPYWSRKETQRPPRATIVIIIGSAAVVVGSLFLPAYGTLSSWKGFGHTYGIEVIAASLILVAVAAVGVAARRGAGLILSATALVLFGFVVPLGPVTGLRYGVWVGTVAAAVAAVAAMVATKQMHGSKT